MEGRQLSQNHAPRYTDPAYSSDFKCIITDGLSYITVEAANWSHHAKRVGAEFVVGFPGKIVSKVTVTKIEPGPNNTPTFHVNDLGNHAPLKRAVLKAAHKGWPNLVSHSFIYLAPPF